MATRNDVAARAGVSPAVVSYVMNDGPRPVAAATRERVLLAMRELDYRPNVVARSLRMRRTRTFGLVVPDNSNPFFAELARAVEDAAFEHGYALLLGNATDDLAREVSYITTFLQRQVDALLLVSVRALPDLQAVLDSGTPLVVLDRSTPGVPAPTVLVDNEGGAFAGTRHLIEHGHERIGCIAGPPDIAVAAERRAGWRRAIDEAGLRAPAALEATAPFSREGGYAAARRLLSARNRPTALFASSDLHGVGALRAATDLGLRIPEDVAVVAFDGTAEAHFTLPGLTSVRQPIRQVAQRAVERLVAMLGGDGGPPTQEVLPVELETRGSCGCADHAPG